MLEDKIKKLGSHYIQNGIYSDYKWVRSYLPLDWELAGNINGVECEREEKTPQIVVFGTNKKDLGFSDVIDSIFNVIKHNEERVEKDVLFKKYVEQLRNIFTTNDISNLRNIVISFGDQKKKGKKIKDVEKTLLVENDNLTNSDVDLNNL